MSIKECMKPNSLCWLIQGTGYLDKKPKQESKDADDELLGASFLKEEAWALLSRWEVKSSKTLNHSMSLIHLSSSISALSSYVLCNWFDQSQPATLRASFQCTFPVVHSTENQTGIIAFAFMQLINIWVY